MIVIDHLMHDTWFMRPGGPPLLPILRSKLIGDLLALLSLDEQRWWTLDELAGRIKGSYPTVAREVRRLEQARLVETEEIGRTKRVRLDAANPLYRPLAELMVRAFGPVVVVAEELKNVGEIHQVMIYGSWAARYQGESGATPHDIDVLVLGQPDRDDVYDAARRAERRLGVEVNTTIRRPDDWASADDSFARQVKEGPLVVIWSRGEHG